MTRQPHYPRVLVIDPAPFNWHHNNGIVKSNWFSGWPHDRLAQLDYSNIQPEFDVCSQYWRLSKRQILQRVLAIPVDGRLNAKAVAGETLYNPDRAHVYDTRSALERRIGALLSNSVRVPIGEGLLRLPTALCSTLRGWIREFNPDVVFSITATGYMLRLVHKVCSLRDIPAVLFFTDDWISTLYRDVWFGSVLRRSMAKWFGECLKCAAVRLTPNDAMRDEYQSRYGGSFETMYYAQPEIDPKPIDRGPRRDGGPLRLLYVGSLAPNRFRSLYDIGNALNDLRSLGIDAKLAIYAFPEEIAAYKSLLGPVPTIELCGTARSEEVPSLLRDADLLVHVEAFDSDSREYTKYSLSTKITQYFMSGNACFAYGPGDGASIRYISDSGAGRTVGVEDPGLLRSTLRDVLTNADLRIALGKTARLVAIERHDATGQRDRFRDAIVRAALTPRHDGGTPRAGRVIAA